MTSTYDSKMQSQESLWSTPWPSDELEDVPACPACGSTERTVDLVDQVFFVASGRWVQKQCSNCLSVYLDPRPDVDSIGKAYGVYYTHSAGAKLEVSEDLSGISKVKRLISNGYRNQRFGTTREPALKFGYWITRLMFLRRLSIDSELRYLPNYQDGYKLLDIGCGNGDFLAKAKSAGWNVLGIDPDPKAIGAAVSNNLDACVGTVETIKDRLKQFDAITLSHVIEHVHEPEKTLEVIFGLLKPGGVVYLDTPNISSYGARFFKQNWQALDCPRHLTLFNPESLTGLLHDIGFENISQKKRPRIIYDLFLKSHRISVGHSPYEESIKLPLWLRLKALILMPTRTRQEYITLTASRPKLYNG